MQPPKTNREPQRIAKLLARAGVASRREIERMIEEGRVALDGKLLDTPATTLTSLRGVTVDGNPVEAAAPARLFIYHKPNGLLVTEHDPKGRATIYDRLPKDLPRLVPVGRLDLNTEGLLLLTTDGELKRLLELPATGVERAYRARVYGSVTQDQLEQLIEGVEIEGVRYGSIDANLERRTGANTWIELILTEGKNREVRRVLEYLGLQVSRLIRTRYGPFVLGDMPPGSVGEVRQHDLVAFRKNPTSTVIAGPPKMTGARGKPVPAEAPVRAERPARPLRRAEPVRLGDPSRPTRGADSRRDERPRPPREGAPRASEARPPRDARPPRHDPRDPRVEEAPARTDGARVKRWFDAPRGADTGARPARDARPARKDDRPRTPRRDGAPSRDEAPRAVGSPARAARAKAHRDARETLVDRPASAARSPGAKPGKKPAGWAKAKTTPKKPTSPGKSPRTRK
uniref:pseudouridine synthase n=1 Tax=Sphingomonas bacterium TaxID=1895847 RepID=UPI002608F95C|nr:pseudouridine synthase [Sphingomonas bacterium]